jgi:hypothetical protein
MDHRAMCDREGCSRVMPPGRSRAGHETCSAACQIMHNTMNQAHRITTATGNGQVWADAVALNDAFSTYVQTESMTYKSARNLGISNEEWRELQCGSKKCVVPQRNTRDSRWTPGHRPSSVEQPR